MPFLDPIYVGVDPTSGHKAFTYAALDGDLNLVALTDGEMEDVLAFLADRDSAAVAINSPSGINRGLVREKMKAEMQTPHQIRGAELRLAEYELRARGIPVTGTPARPELFPAWMQLGLDLHHNLQKMGFQQYSGGASSQQTLETHPHACFCVLLGQSPLPKPTLEGRLQRQLILHERGIHIKDPMDFFEEITRHRLLKGILPIDLIYLPEYLDALVAAYTGWLSMNAPGQVMKVGEEREGQIVLPAGELKASY